MKMYGIEKSTAVISLFNSRCHQIGRLSNAPEKKIAIKKKLNKNILDFIDRKMQENNLWLIKSRELAWYDCSK